jgi:hypothetical protein
MQFSFFVLVTLFKQKSKNRELGWHAPNGVPADSPEIFTYAIACENTQDQPVTVDGPARGSSKCARG